MGARVSGDTVFATVWHSLDQNGLRSEPWLVVLDRRSGRELWRTVLPSVLAGVLIEGAPTLYRNLAIVAIRGEPRGRSIGRRARWSGTSRRNRSRRR